MKFAVGGIAAILALGPLAATAQEAAPACPSGGGALPAELAAWSTPADMASATRAAELAKASLTPSRAARAALHPTREVDYVTQPEKPGGSVAFGGMFDLDIAEAGTYRVILGSGAWIDVLSRGKAVASTSHGRGPACTTARKMVDFPLKKGRHVIQLSANPDPKLDILVQKRP